MQNISYKILSFVLCVAYIFASWGFVRHVCNSNNNNVAYVSLIVNDECNYCAENKNAGKQCCHHHDKQTQTEDDDCCEKTIQKISGDQNYAKCNDILKSIFSAINSALFSSEPALICADLSNTTITYIPPPLNGNIPLIYFTGQLRL
ncbi:MAG: hypothetical protein LBP63_07065 [Prevotellaceae bacterium]|jgi:hypothetical protein|nr:hypothetical protein [Prevotellaceae bacterium]